MGRASSIQIWQYITAIILIFVLTFHLIERVPGLSPLGAKSYEESVEVEPVKKAYSSYGWILGTLLIVALFHGLNGLRGMLLELRTGKGWRIFVETVIWLLFVIFGAIGLHTVLAMT
ncbi:hypothetical protein PYJP_16690 [Pyrofollis japonicus]|uniref:hypothetical protein n=1 Tax=Pyrofollis japonicus TaxID=3060460 RepID=UPI00295BC021|nr:hypothetical protein [Pyrofollis japonicus]BEP18317.1 hypothetical protein PYJP_16690 [Pyrofollis japonicus]